MVTKTGPNTAPFTVTVTPFTFAEFDANNFPLPVELSNVTRPDPAEGEKLQDGPVTIIYTMHLNPSITLFTITMQSIVKRVCMFHNVLKRWSMQ